MSAAVDSTPVPLATGTTNTALPQSGSANPDFNVPQQEPGSRLLSRPDLLRSQDFVKIEALDGSAKGKWNAIYRRAREHQDVQEGLWQQFKKTFMIQTASGAKIPSLLLLAKEHKKYWAKCEDQANKLRDLNKELRKLNDSNQANDLNFGQVRNLPLRKPPLAALVKAGKSKPEARPQDKTEDTTMEDVEDNVDTSDSEDDPDDDPNDEGNQHWNLILEHGGMLHQEIASEHSLGAALYKHRMFHAQHLGNSENNMYRKSFTKINKQVTRVTADYLDSKEFTECFADEATAKTNIAKLKVFRNVGRLYLPAITDSANSLHDKTDKDETNEEREQRRRVQGGIPKEAMGDKVSNDIPENIKQLQSQMGHYGGAVFRLLFNPADTNALNEFYMIQNKVRAVTEEAGMRLDKYDVNMNALQLFWHSHLGSVALQGPIADALFQGTDEPLSTKYNDIREQAVNLIESLQLPASFVDALVPSEKILKEHRDNLPRFEGNAEGLCEILNTRGAITMPKGPLAICLEGETEFMKTQIAAMDPKTRATFQSPYERSQQQCQSLNTRILELSQQFHITVPYNFATHSFEKMIEDARILRDKQYACRKNSGDRQAFEDLARSMEEMAVTYTTQPTSVGVIPAILGDIPSLVQERSKQPTSKSPDNVAPSITPPNSSMDTSRPPSPSTTPPSTAPPLRTPPSTTQPSRAAPFVGASARSKYKTKQGKYSVIEAPSAEVQTRHIKKNSSEPGIVTASYKGQLIKHRILASIKHGFGYQLVLKYMIPGYELPAHKIVRASKYKGARESFERLDSVPKFKCQRKSALRDVDWMDCNIAGVAPAERDDNDTYERHAKTIIILSVGGDIQWYYRSDLIAAFGDQIVYEEEEYMRASGQKFPKKPLPFKERKAVLKRREEEKKRGGYEEGDEVGSEDESDDEEPQSEDNDFIDDSQVDDSDARELEELQRKQAEIHARRKKSAPKKKKRFQATVEDDEE